MKAAISEPFRIACLDHDPRGYPIPWNVLRADDGTPFFTVNDDRKAWRALREGRCPLCGERLGRWLMFVGGPLSAFDPNGWYFDLPGHCECIEYAVQTCPYLAMPKYLGRIDVVHPEKLPPGVKAFLDETQLPERPEVFVTVTCQRVELQERGGGKLQPYIRPADASEWGYWRHGVKISEEEALPYLRAQLGADWQPPRRGR